MNRLRETLKYAVYITLKRLIPLMPRGMFYAVARLIGSVNYRMHAAMCEDLRRNIRMIYHNGKSPAEVERIVEKHFQNRVKHVFEAMLYAHMHKPKYASWFVCEGNWDVVRDLVARKQGCVIPAPEFGGYAMAALRLHQDGLHTSDIAQDLSAMDDMSDFAKRVEAERNATYEKMGGAIITQTHFLRGVMESVKRGEALGVFYDARPTSQMTEGRFLGFWCEMHRGPAAIAMKTRSPLLLMISYRAPDERIHVHVDRLLTPEKSGDKERDYQLTMQKVADFHTPWVLQYPEQWVMLKEFDARLRPEPAAAQLTRA